MVCGVCVYRAAPIAHCRCVYCSKAKFSLPVLMRGAVLRAFLLCGVAGACIVSACARRYAFLLAAYRACFAKKRACACFALLRAFAAPAARCGIGACAGAGAARRAARCLRSVRAWFAFCFAIAQHPL